MIKKFFLLLIIVFISLQVSAQRSEEIRKIGRTKYYVHHVQKGHTLYAISKVYSVSIEDIILANPGVENGLSIDQEILIPVKSVDKKEAKSNPPELENGQLIHTVSKGETIYGIAKKYKVSVEELVNNNSQIGDGLKEGMKLLINQQTIPDLEAQLIEPALPDDYIIHEVREKETLYGISKMYTIGIDEIVEINPALSEGLKEGMLLNIPKTKLEAGDIGDNIQIAKLSKPLSKEKYKVGLFLPFMLDVVDTIFTHSEVNNVSPELNAYSLVSVEFYNGFMMAVDSLKNQGLNVELYIYDLAKDEYATNLLINMEELSTLDMFVGPFHYSSFKPLAELAKRKQIKIISPLSQPNKLMLYNENVLECEPSVHTQTRAIADYLKQSSDSNSTVLMLSNFDYKVKPLCDEFESHARRIGLQYSSVSVEFAEREFELVIPENLRVKLDSTKVNRIFVISNDEGYISRLFDRMNAIDTSKFALEVYGLSHWLSIDQINSRYKVKYKLLLPIVHYIDYQDETIKDFIRNYKRIHNTVPIKFGFLGFDVAYYHLNELLQHGTNYEQYFSFASSAEGLQSRYNFKQYQQGSGYENSGLYFVRYENYELVLIDKYPFERSLIEEESLIEEIKLDSIPEKTHFEID